MVGPFAFLRCHPLMHDVMSRIGKSWGTTALLAACGLAMLAAIAAIYVSTSTVMDPDPVSKAAREIATRSAVEPEAFKFREGIAPLQAAEINAAVPDSDEPILPAKPFAILSQAAAGAAQLLRPGDRPLSQRQDRPQPAGHGPVPPRPPPPEKQSGDNSHEHLQLAKSPAHHAHQQGHVATPERTTQGTGLYGRSRTHEDQHHQTGGGGASGPPLSFRPQPGISRKRHFFCS